MSQTDAMLFEHWLHDRNADAFKLLATRYAAMVYQTCRRILNNPSEAEDVAQECFVILASTEKPIGGYLAPWLHRVAYNRSLARLRAENRRREREVRYASEQPAARDMAWDEIGGLVDEAIAELPEKLRVPIVAYFLDGQTQEAVAHALGISRPTVTHRVDKGVECLRKALKGKGVAVAGTVLAGAIKANASAEVPATLVASLGKLALSGVNHVALPAAAAAMPLAKTVAGFWTAKTMLAGTASLAVVLLAGWQVHQSAVKPDTPVAQTQVSGKPLPASTILDAPAVPPVKAPEPQARTAAVAPIRKNREKTATEQPPPQGLVAGANAGRNLQVAQNGPGMLEKTLDSITFAWQNVRGTLNGENQRRSFCANNLKRLGVYFKMFENENPEQYFPALNPNAGLLMFANENPGMKPVFPEYVTDPTCLVCPSDTQRKPLLKKGGAELLDNSSYCYLGYAIQTIEDLEAFSDAYTRRIAAKLPFDADLDTPRGKLYRLREGIERFFVTDINNAASAEMAQSSIPVLIETRHHDPDGGNVLYMDGHVEYRRYQPDGSFPMNKATWDILNALIATKGAVGK